MTVMRQVERLMRAQLVVQATLRVRGPQIRRFFHPGPDESCWVPGMAPMARKTRRSLGPRVVGPYNIPNMSAKPAVLGLDIGGANLKAAHSHGSVGFMPFPLWKAPTRLPDALRALLKPLPPCDVIAVTMTGELCDCFETKQQGVNAILDAVEAIADKVPVRVWQTTGRFVDVPTACATPQQTAAANWLALATFAGRFAPDGTALVIDIGSTTTDIIPLDGGRPVPSNWTDPERLRSQELVYTGVQRTPVCALLGAEGAAELFATTRDVYLTLGSLPEMAHDRDTADGRPATKACAHARLARMLCADARTCTREQIDKLATRVLQKQVYVLQNAVEAVAGRLGEVPRVLVLAGSGEFLASVVVSQLRFKAARVISLAEQLGPEISRAACAHALVMLATESNIRTQ